MSGTPIRVLVVDDDEATREGIAAICARAGFGVETAAGGFEALEKARAQNGEFSVAVIDQRMNQPNGVQTMQELHRYYPWIETIILTGFGELEPGEQALELGAYRYMGKPEADNTEELLFNIKMAARFGRLRRREQAQEALSAASSRLSQAKTTQEVYKVLWDLAKRLLPSIDGFVIGRWDVLNRIVSFPFCELNGEDAEWPDRPYNPVLRGITEYVIDTGEGLLLANGDREFREMRGLTEPRTHRYAISKIVVPMTWQGEVTGTVTVLSHRPGVQYTADHLTILQAMADLAAATLENVGHQIEAAQLAGAVEELMRQGEADAVERTIVEQAQALIEPDFTGLIICERGGILRRIMPVIPAEYQEFFLDPRQGDGLTAWVVKNRKPKPISDTEAEDLVKPEVREKGIAAMLVMPLIHEDEVMGVLYAHRLRRHEWSEHDLKLWSTFAALAGAKLHTAQAQRRDADEAELLATEMGNLSERMSYEECLSTITGAARTLFGADMVRFTEVNPYTSRMATVTFQLTDEAEFIEPPRPHGLTDWVLRQRTPILRGTVSAGDEPPERAELLAAGLPSHAAVPLLYQGRVIAVIHCLYFNRAHEFQTREKNRLLVFANVAAVAVHRVQHDSARDRWERLAQTLHSMTEPDAAARELAAQAQTLLSADEAVLLWNVGQKNGVCTYELPFACGSAEGMEPPGDRLLQEIMQAENGLLIRNRLGTDESAATAVGLRLDIALAGRRQNATLILQYAQPTDFYAPDLVPLRRAATVVERVWLMKELQFALEKRDRQVEAVARITEALRTGSNTETLLATIAKIYVEVLGADACTVLEWEPGSNRFLARATAGLINGSAAFTTEDIEHYLQWFVNNRGPLYIEDATGDERLRTSAFVAREEIKTMVVYRLRVEDTVFGLLFANYRAARAQHDLEIVTMRIWADLAASVIRSSRQAERIESHMVLAKLRLKPTSREAVVESRW